WPSRRRRSSRRQERPPRRRPRPPRPPRPTIHPSRKSRCRPTGASPRTTPEPSMTPAAAPEAATATATQALPVQDPAMDLATDLATPSVRRRLMVMVYESFLLLAVEMLAVLLYMLVTGNRQDPIYQHGRTLFLFLVAGAYF